MIVCVTSITDFISKIQNPSLWTRLHLVHYWDVLLEAGSDVLEAFLLSAAKIEAEDSQKLKKRTTLSGRPTTCLRPTPSLIYKGMTVCPEAVLSDLAGERRLRLPQTSRSNAETAL